MSDARPDPTTKSAFLSPTRLAARRLSQHQYRGPRTLSPTGSDLSAYSSRSRRSQSMIRSPEDAEVFENISSATGVRVAASSKRKNRLRDCTSPPVTAMRSLSPTSYVSSDLGLSSSMSMDQNDNSSKNEFFYSEHTGAYGEKKDFFRKDPVPLESTSLDFIHSDSSFQVLANVLVDFFDARVRNGQLTLEANDSEFIERLLPASARRHFIEAVQQRLERTPASPQSQLDFLTIQCQQLGLDRDGPENPIIATAMLDENETYVTLPVLGSKSKEETIQPSDSDGSDGSEQNWVDLRKDTEQQQPKPTVVHEISQSVKAETATYESNRVGTAARDAKEMTRGAPVELATYQAPAIVIDEQNLRQEQSFDFPDLDSTDNIAQRTLLMELHEARQMMQTSTSPETIEFWENHVEDLKAKYRSLLGKPRLSSAPILPPSPTTTIDTHEYHSAQPSMSMESGFEQLPESRHPAQAQPTVQLKKAIFFPQQTPVSHQLPDRQSSLSMDPPQTYIPPTPVVYEPPTVQPSKDPSPTSTRAETSFSALPATPNPPASPVETVIDGTGEVDDGSIAPQTPCPPATPAPVLAQILAPSTTSGPAPELAKPPTIPQMDAESIAPQTPCPPATPAPVLVPTLAPSTTSGPAPELVKAPAIPQLAVAQLPEPNYEIPMVDVVAPADLPGGYNFEAELEGHRFLATVPAGGVKEGETFTCYMRQLDSMAIDIPVGYWRDGILGLCSYGCCHPVAWNSMLCPLVALAQVQYRANLDFLGRPNLFYGAAPNRAMMVTIIMFWIVINAMLCLGYYIKWSQAMELTIADWTALAVINGAYLCFIVFVTQSTRSSLRDKYLIREHLCSDLEDLCCATCCLPCSISQMSRHTGNYDEYEAVCCSRTGLPDGVGEHEQTPLRPSQGSTYVV